MKIPEMRWYYLLLLQLVFFTACQRVPTRWEEAKVEDKNYPNERFFLQRAYPDKTIPIHAYMNRIKTAALAAKAESGYFNGNWTIQGPANLGARINAIAAVPGSNTIYVGFSNGGVWKSYDDGAHWFPVFDDQPFLSIGEITIDPNDTSVLYVGTGDPNITGLPFIGNGVYKSENGGQTWIHLGLSETYITSRILINPSNSQQIFVATMGLPFERTPDRGVYRSDDGGQTWQKILFLSDQAGVIDLVMNPQNPQELLAAGWDRIRNNHESVVYGPHSKVYKTTDGGDTWSAVAGGLPQGIHSRIGLAICASQPNVMYAMYVGTDFQLAGIYRTVDGGNTWSEVAGSGLSNPMGGFGWYFGQIRVAPDDPDNVFLLGVLLWHSVNGGASWTGGYSDGSHYDKHDLIWDDAQLWIGTDGGLYRSANGDVLIRSDNIPVNQVYRTAYNSFHPQTYYAGMQDNGSASGNAGGIESWFQYLGGDGFQTWFDSSDSLVFYAETQNGHIHRTDDGGLSFNYFSGSLDDNDRRNWDMPYLVSRFHPKVLYAGTYRVYRFDTLGQLFVPVSEDLTQGNIYGSQFHTISAMDESYFTDGELYVGTTDGQVWRSDSNTWVNITAGLPDRYVTSIHASPSVSGRIFVTHSGYKDNDYIPRVHRSDDLGTTWTDISGDLPDLAVNDILVVPQTGDSTLVVATDGGVYATLDGGGGWKRVGDMPRVHVMDLEYNAAQNQIIAATFGRSIMTFPVDSLTPAGQELIAGDIKTPEGIAVPAQVRLTMPDSTYEWADEIFFEGLSPQGPYHIAAKNDSFPVQSINVLDLLLIYQYILGKISLDDFQKHAADADASGSIDVGDLVVIRSLTLGIIDSFPDGHVWRFYAPAGVETATNDWGGGEQIILDSLPADSLHFKAVKTGDVNRSWPD